MGIPILTEFITVMIYIRQEKNVDKPQMMGVGTVKVVICF
jgi:hypothetical protein